MKKALMVTLLSISGMKAGGVTRIVRIINNTPYSVTLFQTESGLPGFRSETIPPRTNQSGIVLDIPWATNINQLLYPKSDRCVEIVINGLPGNNTYRLIQGWLTLPTDDSVRIAKVDRNGKIVQSASYIQGGKKLGKDVALQIDLSGGLTPDPLISKQQQAVEAVGAGDPVFSLL